MSQALYNKITELECRLTEVSTSLEAKVQKLAASLEHVGEDQAERKELRRELRDLRERMATFDALKESVARDAREILGAVRERIDPTKVKMPHPLKALGYGAPR